MTDRPLGAFSDFVVGRMGTLIATAPMSIPHLVELLLSEMDQVELEKIARSSKVAVLDLQVAEAAIAHSAGPEHIPAILINLNDRLAGKRSPGLTYSGIIEDNPLGDPRCFLPPGEKKRTEEFFYSVHRGAEAILEDALSLLAGIAEVPRERLDTLPTLMTALGFMPEGHFPAFRPFISKLPHRPVDGPSGAYSYRVPLLELQMWGDWIPEVYRRDIEGKLFYFPQEGEERVRASLQQKDSYKDVALKTGDRDVAVKLVMVAEVLEDFREKHLEALKRILPDVFADSAPGTMGHTGAGTYVRKRMEMMAQMRPRFLSEFKPT